MPERREIPWGHIGIVSLHVVALAAWWGKSLFEQLAPEGDDPWGLNLVGAVLAVVGLAALLAYLALPHPRSDRDRPGFDRRSVGLHILYTWSLATCLALWAYVDYQASNHQTASEEALKVWFLALGFFAGFLNLTRSTGTRSTTSTIHAMTTRMAQQLDLVRRGQKVNGELYAHAVTAQLASSHEALASAMLQMVDAARSHPTIPPDRLTVTLWVRGEHHWRILAGSGITDETRERFVQPVQDTPTPGAGIVANLAASGQKVLVEAHIEDHPWYTRNPYRDGAQSGIAVVQVEDFQGQPIAALCLTARPGTLLPTPEHDPEAHAELLRLLMAWKIAFTLPMLRLIDMESR